MGILNVEIVKESMTIENGNEQQQKSEGNNIL